MYHASHVGSSCFAGRYCSPLCFSTFYRNRPALSKVFRCDLCFDASVHRARVLIVFSRRPSVFATAVAALLINTLHRAFVRTQLNSHPLLCAPGWYGYIVVQRAPADACSTPKGVAKCTRRNTMCTEKLTADASRIDGDESTQHTALPKLCTPSYSRSHDSVNDDLRVTAFVSTRRPPPMPFRASVASLRSSTSESNT